MWSHGSLFPVPGSLLPSHVQMLDSLRRASLPLRLRDVAGVAKVLHAHLAREETGCRHVPHPVEERHAVTEPGLRFLRPRDVVEHLAALRVGRGEEGFAGAEAIRAFAVEPGQPTTHVHLCRCRCHVEPARGIRWTWRRCLIGQHEVDVLRCTRVGGPVSYTHLTLPTS